MTVTAESIAGQVRARLAELAWTLLVPADELPAAVLDELQALRRMHCALAQASAPATGQDAPAAPMSIGGPPLIVMPLPVPVPAPPSEVPINVIGTPPLPQSLADAEPKPIVALDHEAALAMQVPFRAPAPAREAVHPIDPATGMPVGFPMIAPAEEPDVAADSSDPAVADAAGTTD